MTLTPVELWRFLDVIRDGVDGAYSHQSSSEFSWDDLEDQRRRARISANALQSASESLRRLMELVERTDWPQRRSEG